MGAIFKRSNLRYYYVVPGPGTYIITVANTVKPNYLIEDGDKSRYIVNLRAGTQSSLEEAVSLIPNDKHSVPFSDVSDCFFTGVIWQNNINDIDSLPIKGEKIIATFEELLDGLRCTALSTIPRQKLDLFELKTLDQSQKLFKLILENDKLKNNK